MCTCGYWCACPCELGACVCVVCVPVYKCVRSIQVHTVCARVVCSLCVCVWVPVYKCAEVYRCILGVHGCVLPVCVGMVSVCVWVGCKSVQMYGWFARVCGLGACVCGIWVHCVHVCSCVPDVYWVGCLCVWVGCLSVWYRYACVQVCAEYTDVYCVCMGVGSLCVWVWVPVCKWVQKYSDVYWVGCTVCVGWVPVCVGMGACVQVCRSIQMYTVCACGLWCLVECGYACVPECVGWYA